MADANFSIGQIGITGHLIINARKTTDPNVVAYFQKYPPPVDNVLNITFANIDTGIYYFDFFDSPDGIALGSLVSSFFYDVRNKVPVSEKRYYTVGGPREIDPIAGGETLTDPFLDGKDISFYKADRYLIPPSQPNPEYTNGPGGAINLLSGLIFSEGEVVMVETNYTIYQTENAMQGIFAGTADIFSSLTLDNTFYNKLISCNSSSARLVVTLPDISAIPDGKFFYFIFQAGNQHQVRFITQFGNEILFAGDVISEISIGKGEVLWIEKRNGSFRVLNDMPGALSVGIPIYGYINHPNTLPANHALFDGDDYPRPWQFITTKLNPGSVILAGDEMLADTYVMPVGGEGKWVRHNTLKKFRTPNKQGYYEKALDNAVTFSAGNYPGNTQAGQVGGHFHDSGTETNDSPKYNRSASNHETKHWSGQNNVSLQQDSTDINKKPDGSYATKNEVDAVLLIPLVRI